jgi:hypothetical protein
MSGEAGSEDPGASRGEVWVRLRRHEEAQKADKNLHHTNGQC